MPGSTILIEFSTVQVLHELSTFGSSLKYCFNTADRAKWPRKQGDRYWEMSVKGGSTV